MILCKQSGEENEKIKGTNISELKFLIQKESSYIQKAYYTF